MDALAVLLPRRCGVCGALGEALCTGCRRSLVRIAPPGCERCGAPGPWPVRRCVECTGRRLAFATARAAIVYEARARSFVSSWKERGRRDLASLAAELVVEAVPAAPAPTLVTVPSDLDRLLKRGTSTAEALADALARLWDVERRRLVERRGHRRPGRQRGLSLAQRRSNVRGAFTVRLRPPEAVCLVDDVYTTGSTVNECAAALRRAGAARVDVVTFARALRAG